MRSLVIGTALVGALIGLAGCDTTSALASYTPSTPNVLAFQSALKPTGATVRVGDFTAGPGVEAPLCRLAGTLDVTSGKPLEQYVKDALQTEPFTAQVYDVNSSVTISGRLDQADVNTWGTGSWTLGLQVTSNSDPVGYRVQAVRTFDSSFSGAAACRNATSAFIPTVQDLIGQVVNHPGFVKVAGRS